MLDTVEIVKNIIGKDGAIKTDLARGLINVSALARFIQITARKTGANLSLEAIISAIRRYPVDQNIACNQEIGSLIRKLTMRNKIMDVSLMNPHEITQEIGKVASLMNYTRSDTFRVVSGVETVKIVIGERNMEELKRIIPKKNIQNIFENLSEIIILLKEESIFFPGVVARISTELAINGINMIEFITCNPEHVIVVHERDALRAYEAIERLGRIENTA